MDENNDIIMNYIILSNAPNSKATDLHSLEYALAHLYKNHIYVYYAGSNYGNETRFLNYSKIKGKPITIKEKSLW